MSNSPKVSVIIPAYNAQDFIAKCLDSMVNQTIDSYEVLVINDGSSDNTQAVVEAYQEKYPDIITGIVFSEGGYFAERNLVEITVKDGKRNYTYTNSHYY